MTVTFKPNAVDFWHQLCYLGYRTGYGRVSASLILLLPLLEIICFAVLSPPHSHFRHFFSHYFWLFITSIYLIIAATLALIMLTLSFMIPKYSITINKDHCRLQSIFPIKSPWRHFLRLADEGDYFFFTGWRATICFPKRAFQRPTEANAFFETAIRYWCEAKALPVPVRTAPDLSGVWPPAPLTQNSAELDGNRNG